MQSREAKLSLEDQASRAGAEAYFVAKVQAEYSWDSKDPPGDNIL